MREVPQAGGDKFFFAFSGFSYCWAYLPCCPASHRWNNNLINHRSWNLVGLRLAFKLSNPKEIARGYGVEFSHFEALWWKQRFLFVLFKVSHVSFLRCFFLIPRITLEQWRRSSKEGWYAEKEKQSARFFFSRAILEEFLGCVYFSTGRFDKTIFLQANTGKKWNTWLCIKRSDLWNKTHKPVG